jgi:hypothetical protein
MNSPILPLIKEILIILLGLFVFLVLKDKYTKGTSLWVSLKERTIQAIVSPFFIPGIGILVVVAIYYIVYTLFFS